MKCNEHATTLTIEINKLEGHTHQPRDKKSDDIGYRRSLIVKFSTASYTEGHDDVFVIVRRVARDPDLRCCI